MKESFGFLKRAAVLSALFSVFMLGIASLSKDAPPSPLLAPQSADACRYLVQPGDTLLKIALRFTGKGENYKHIMQFNRLASEQIRPGGQVNIPKALLRKEYPCASASVVTPTLLPGATPTLLLPTPGPTPIFTPPTTVTSQPMLTPPPRKSNKILAEIQGVVFEDVNGNGAREADEPGLPGVQVILVRDCVTQTTDQAGQFLFGNLQPGPQAVGLAETSLPPGYALTTAATVLISVTEGDLGYVKFGAQKSARAQ